MQEKMGRFREGRRENNRKIFGRLSKIKIPSFYKGKRIFKLYKTALYQRFQYITIGRF